MDYFEGALRRFGKGISGVDFQPPSPLPRSLYDVFFSFRGKDTRGTFISHLYSSLSNVGIQVYKDDETLPRGDQITSILQAIENSKISIIVFSRNYPESRWCMLELETIMKCHRSMGQVVLPIFYDVDPSEVRHQRGRFGEAFEDLMNGVSMRDNKVLKWREALNQAGGIAGFSVINSRNESKDIENIFERVSNLLNKTDLLVADHPVGVKSRVKNVIQLLNNHPSNEVILVGIWGMGGVGKTTLAKAIYNEIGRDFEGRSFLFNIREVWDQDNGQVRLQEQLLHDIYKKKKLKIHSIESGKMLLKERLRHKRVLLVLDDVNDLDQLRALSGSRKWFGRGSRILITTRDQHLLKGPKVNYMYRMKEMDESESMELFSWHAFKQAGPKDDFTELTKNVIAYSGGLPLALEVLGSYLFDREMLEWKSVLEKLKRIPHDQIQKKLKISFDGLDSLQKEIFLDISCFLLGMERNVATHILNDSGFFAEIGISVLIERSLVTVDKKNKLRVHDLLRDMGREIIREESPNVAEARSRLWFHEDVLDVLSKHTGAKAIEGLALKLPRTNTVCLSTKAFAKMERLRLLQLRHVQLAGDQYEYLSRNLRWLCWHGFPLRCTPKNFYQGGLVAIELKNSNLQQVWKNPQFLEKLKILNLSHSLYLRQTPDFSNLPNLERLILKDCRSLSVIHQTIGHLNKILLINLKECTSLHNLPRSIYNLRSLKILILSGSNIEKLEEDIEKMESLTTLIADNTAITRVPFSIVRSKRIGYISLCGFEGLSRDVFPSLIWSWMSPKNNPLSLIQPSEGMSSLVSIHVPNSSLHYLSSMLSELPRLRSLWVECGSHSQLTQDVGRILDTLYAANCKESETSQISGTENFALNDFCSQVQISASENSLRCLIIQMGRNDQITNSLTDSLLQQLTASGSGDFSLPGDKHPEWLAFKGEGPSVVFEVPQVSGFILKRMMLCVIYSSIQDNTTCEHINNVLIINYTKTTIQIYKQDTLLSFEDEECQSFISNLEPGDKVEVIVVSGFGLTLKKTTVYLIYGASIQEKMERSHASDKFALVDETVCRKPTKLISKRKFSYKSFFNFFQKCLNK